MRVIKVYKVDEQTNKATSQGKEQRHYNKNLITTKRKVYIKVIIMKNSKHWRLPRMAALLYVSITLAHLVAWSTSSTKTASWSSWKGSSGLFTPSSVFVRVADSSPEQISDLSQATEQSCGYVVRRSQLSVSQSRATMCKATPGLVESTGFEARCS